MLLLLHQMLFLLFSTPRKMQLLLHSLLLPLLRTLLSLLLLLLLLCTLLPLLLPRLLPPLLFLLLRLLLPRLLLLLRVQRRPARGKVLGALLCCCLLRRLCLEEALLLCSRGGRGGRSILGSAPLPCGMKGLAPLLCSPGIVLLERPGHARRRAQPLLCCGLAVAVVVAVGLLAPPARVAEACAAPA